MPTRETPPPPSTDPRPGRNPGYAEPQPKDRDAARQAHPQPPRNPDEGGMDRDPDGTATDPESQA